MYLLQSNVNHLNLRPKMMIALPLTITYFTFSLENGKRQLNYSELLTYSQLVVIPTISWAYAMRKYNVWWLNIVMGDFVLLCIFGFLSYLFKLFDFVWWTKCTTTASRVVPWKTTTNKMYVCAMRRLCTFRYDQIEAYR